MCQGFSGSIEKHSKAEKCWGWAEFLKSMIAYINSEYAYFSFFNIAYLFPQEIFLWG